MKKVLSFTLTLLFIILLLSGCSSSGKVMNIKTAKETLISNTEYVRQNILGTWTVSDGTIAEFYSNGMAVNYTPVLTNSESDANLEFTIKSELQSIGYNGYEIPDPESYTDSELQSYAEYLQRSDKIGISIKTEFFGSMADKFVLYEFLNDDTLIMGNLTLTRVRREEPTVSSSASGLYINEKDRTLSVAIIQVKNEQTGYISWSGSPGEAEGNCEISDQEIRAKFFDIADFTFKKFGNGLIEIGSNEIKGSNLTYKKISDLAYSSQIDIAAREDGYLLTTTKFGRYEWYIIKQEADKQLLLSKDAVASLEGETSEISKGEWVNNYIREYLNNDFYNSFADTEKSRILVTHNLNELITTQGVQESAATDDKVFLLTNDELAEYLSFNDELLCKYNGKSTFWFTRTALQFNNGIVLSGINAKGQIYGKDNYESGQYEYANCIRPAIWVAK